MSTNITTNNWTANNWTVNNQRSNNWGVKNWSAKNWRVNHWTAKTTKWQNYLTANNKSAKTMEQRNNKRVAIKKQRDYGNRKNAHSFSWENFSSFRHIHLEAKSFWGLLKALYISLFNFSGCFWPLVTLIFRFLIFIFYLLFFSLIFRYLVFSYIPKFLWLLYSFRYFLIALSNFQIANVAKFSTELNTKF